MARSVKLAPALIESLFERGESLYASDAEQMAAVARGDKGNCENHFTDERHIAQFVAQAHEHGLVVDRRPLCLPDREPLTALCATRPGEEWRAEVLEWAMEGMKLSPRSERSTYLQSRAYGYSHEQSVQWIEMCRHQTPVHGVNPSICFCRSQLRNG